MIATVPHHHRPLYRVVRRDWSDPLDATFSRSVSDNRWNTPAFPALYCCCSEPVARAVATERLQRLSLSLEDLAPDAYPQLVELDWGGTLVDVASSAGLVANGFPPTFPQDTPVGHCQQAAAEWHAQGHQGILCRSASLCRLGWEARWAGDHRPWGETVIFPRQGTRKPRLIRRRDDLAWLQTPPTGA